MYFDEERNEVRIEDCDFRSLTPIDRLVLNSERVKAIEMVIDHYKEENKKLTEDIHRQVYGDNSVYIAEYTTHDDYGPLRETDVFSEEIDAWAFVLKQREEGATDISVKPRLVYLDKDRTVNFND
jgi:hypothetical protein